MKLKLAVKVKECFVPGCKNTSETTPQKIFVQVPPHPEERAKWCQAVKKSPKTGILYCCQDHFNFHKDLEKNNKTIKVKPNVVPHLFVQNSDSESTVPEPQSHNNLELIYLAQNEDNAGMKVMLDKGKPSREKLSKNETFAKMHVGHIERNPKLYVGIDKTKLGLLKDLQDIQYEHALICLQKIKHNTSNFILSDMFGLTELKICNVFNKTVKALANQLSEHITWQDKESTLSSLPELIRNRYKGIEAIIDCFEVHLNEYCESSKIKRTSKIKFLISTCPNGIINFVSDVFSGDKTDNRVLEQSQFLDFMPVNAQVMPIRRFSGAGGLLSQKNCKLLDNEVETVSEEDPVNQDQTMMALKMCMDRTFRRLRRFAMLQRYVKVNQEMMHLYGDIMKVACAVSNLQGPVFK